MAKEKIKYHNGEEVEVDVHHLGYRRANQIAEDYFPMDKMTQHANGDESMSGNFKIAAARRVALESIKELDLDKLQAVEAARIYNKYFDKEIMAAIGKGSDPN